MTRRRLLLSGVLVLALSACGNDSPAPNSTDRTFLQDMSAHHSRAIEVAHIGVTRASDPRVRAFAERIVREQTPELHTMRGRVSAAHLTIDSTTGSRMATNRISDAEVANLRARHGAAFDQRFLALNISSEQGAASMARTELSGGVDAASRTLAKSIASAPSTQIPELKALLAKIS